MTAVVATPMTPEGAGAEAGARECMTKLEEVVPRVVEVEVAVPGSMPAGW